VFGVILAGVVRKQANIFLPAHKNTTWHMHMLTNSHNSTSHIWRTPEHWNYIPNL